MVEQRTAPDALAYAVEETEANADADALDPGPLAWHREVLRHLNAAGWLLVPSDARQSGDRVPPAPYDTLSATDREVWA